jgi:hypothetical protein
MQTRPLLLPQPAHQDRLLLQPEGCGTRLLLLLPLLLSHLLLLGGPAVQTPAGQPLAEDVPMKLD